MSTFIQEFVDNHNNKDVFSCYETKSSSYGLLDYTREYYMKKYHSSYEKMFSSLLASMIKYSVQGTDIQFFTMLFDENICHYECKYLNKSLNFLKKHSSRFSKRTISYKMVRLTLQEVLHFLGKTFGKKVDRKINEKNIQARIRDYIASDNAIIDFSGHDFMRII